MPTKDPDRIEKIQRIAYHIWLARRDNDASGDADEDYFQAERIFESHKMRRQAFVASFCVWAVTFFAAQSPEPYLVNAARAADAFDSLPEEYDLTLYSGRAFSVHPPTKTIPGPPLRSSPG